MFRPPRLGIGAVYTPALGAWLTRRPDALDLLEIEPQTMWLAEHPIDGPFRPFGPAFEAFLALGRRALVHSVGVPLGGTRRPEAAQMRPLRAMVERLDPPWVSEHLSVAGTPHRAAGFLLPPLQTDAGVAVAADNIRRFRDGVGRPVAIETGVSYLARKPFEMADGEFLARVAEAADCGVLLDLHNLYCNERNGRESIETFLERAPLERVWELHLAGGSELDGYWLDAHSGAVPDALLEIARATIERLPNLGALNIEIYATFLERMADEELDALVHSLRELWDGAGGALASAQDDRSSAPPPVASSAARLPEEGGASLEEPRSAPLPADWEHGLTRALWQGDAAEHPFVEDAAAVRLYAKLAASFRGSMLSRALPRGIRYLILREPTADADTLLGAYLRDVPAQMYAPLEARGFLDWTRARETADPLLIALLEYDVATLEVELESRARSVRFPGDPRPIFEALSESRLPRVAPDATPWEIELLPEDSRGEPGVERIA